MLLNVLLIMRGVNMEEFFSLFCYGLAGLCSVMGLYIIAKEIAYAKAIRRTAKTSK
jgi:hypothetical protein